MNIDVHAHITSKELLNRGGYEIEQKGDDCFVIHSGPKHAVTVTGEMFSTERQAETMTRQGIDLRVLCNGPSWMGMEKNGEESAVWNRLNNEYIAECCAEMPDRFKGFCTVPLDDMDAAIRELHYSVEKLGLAGLEIATHFRGMNFDEEYFAPLFRELNDMKLPVIMHPTAVRVNDALSIGYFKNLLGNPFETATAAARMLITGFFDRYPDMRLELMHGGGALPYQLGRLGHWHKQYVGEDGRFRLPKNLYFDIIVFEEDILEFLAKRCHNVVLGTDAPFDMAEDDPVRFVERSVSEERAREILETLPAEFLGL